MELRTKRFLLRDFVEDDVGAFEAYHSDPRFLEYYGNEASEAGHARRLIERFQSWAVESPRRNFQLAVVRCGATPALVGCAGLRCSGAPSGSAEIGIEMAPKYWGLYGYAGEILGALAELAFETLGLESVYGRTVSANLRIGRLLAAIGAQSVECPTPAWMSAKGWQQLEWRLGREQWNRSRLVSSPAILKSV